ncbi:GNAT family N-acetyltransferase [Rossellomorea aquimaris]|uniref:GNAT family N-acetyltransferase n=1 Tax=Rossellomorea aquimaris TaxID=189382 RepID=UPI001CD2DB07|nr:GNAT family N-acetyltransferase [Rossellomorea aquimaris]MCA1054110.1 GNAT family N-acetyltransferase [Rossellomorea aquimaris]
MYETRRATEEELPIILDYWYRMAIEMARIDGIPEPDLERLEEVKTLFLKETERESLTFRVALNHNDQIVACAGGLLRYEYLYPLAADQSLFGWVISVYTIEEHRHNGLAATLVDEICIWLKEKGAKRARLWSSSTGRNVYENLGFTRMLDMSKPLV